MARSSPLISVFGGPVVDERIYHLRDMGPTGWFAGPVGELFGIPSFWIARLAKLLQFVSGSVILIDLIGQERIEAYSARVRQSLTALAARHSVGRIAGDLGATTRAYWRVLVGKAEDDAALRKALFATRFGEWGYLVGVLGAIPVAAWLAVRWHLAWYHAAWLLFLVVAVGASIAIGTYLLVMPVLRLLLWATVVPLERIVEALCRVAVQLLARLQLSWLALAASYFVLLTACVLELLAS